MLTHVGSWMRTGTPPKATSEKHIGERSLKDGVVEYQHRRDAVATRVALAEVTQFVASRKGK